MAFRANPANFGIRALAFRSKKYREAREKMIPGEFDIPDGEVILNRDRPTVEVSVSNSGDRPIQVGSHYHFAEVNPALVFDRAKAYGFRLNIIAGTSVRFEPGQVKSVTLTAMTGLRRVVGFRAQVMGPLKDQAS
jgi:urease subunit beta